MNVRPHVFRVAATAAVLAPFALSVAAHAVPGRPERAVAAARPPLAFGEYLLNLGRLPDGVAARGVFRFRNVGESPLTILGFAPSCGCLNPRLEERSYAPGASGAFAVFADTANELSTNEDSLKQHHVDVRYDAGEGERTERVHLKFVLPARHVTVEPRSLLVYQFGTMPTTREIKVTDPRTPPVTITAVESTSPRVAVEASLAESTDDPARATIAVTIPADLDRNVNAVLKLHTDDPANPVLFVPVQAFVRDATSSGVAEAPSAVAAERR